tara:strand:- start:175 stop:1434 length:1260 start_codon:yes stop_codon:yes gene_type:complete
MALTKISRSLLDTGVSDSSDATAITITSAEKVGIGTSDPSQLLHVQSATFPVVEISCFSNDNPTDGSALDLVEKQPSAASSTNTFGQTGVYGFRLKLNGSDNTLRIKSGSQTTVTDRITLARDTGNVGIGTTSPSMKLNISHADQDGLRFNVANDAETFIDFGDTDDNDVGQISYDHADNSMAFRTNATERMIIDSNGTVGIGSTPPSTIRNDGHATEKALQVGRALVLFSDGGVTTDLNNNSHLNNSDQRVAMTGTLAGSFYQQYQGIHTFYTAPAVSAPNIQTHTLRFRIALDGTLAGTSTSISSLSDERAKKNIEDYTGGLDLLKSLRPRTFEFKDTTGVRKTGTQRGFIAQEILESDSYWITEEDASDTKDAEYEYTKDTEKRYLTTLNDKDAVFVSAIKELLAKVEELESKINE